MQNSIFVVNDEPYCIWEVDLLWRNQQFLAGLDADYFNYLLNLYLDSDDENRAALALKTVLHHSMETLFSLLGAFIQAPDCAYAWIAKCSNKDLRALIDRVNSNNQTVFTKLQVEHVDWENLAGAVLSCYKPNTNENAILTKKFAELWSKLSRMFNEKIFIDEYNSVKHGFRIKSGGFFVRAGMENEYGVSPPERDMIAIGATKHGSTFLTIDKIDSQTNSRAIKSRNKTVGWTVEMVAPLCQLVYMSINNVISGLKTVNNFAPDTCRYLAPADFKFFDEPWIHVPGISHISFEPFLDESRVRHASKSELLDLLIRHGKFC